MVRGPTADRPAATSALDTLYVPQNVEGPCRLMIYHDTWNLKDTTILNFFCPVHYVGKKEIQAKTRTLRIERSPGILIPEKENKI